MQDEIIAEASALYAAGFNVFPIQFASKQPYGSTSLLTTTRIHESYIKELFTDSGIGVMTGRLSQNLFVLDCDDEDTYTSVGEHLADRHINAWIRLGMRGGQFWLRCAEGEVQNVNLGKLQVLGNRQHTVAPPSVHPEGVFYDWAQRDGALPPLVSLRQMDFLGLSLAGEQKRSIKRDKTTLPPTAYRVLVEEDITGYDSNSEAEFAACLSLIAVGMPDAVIRTVFAQFNPPHYAKRRGRSFDQHTLVRAHVWLIHQRAEEDDADSYSHPHSDQFVRYADGRPWPGRTGNTDKAVYLALCRRMRMEKGSRLFRGSVRELSELANVGTQAVQASLKRLRTGGLVKYESKDSASGACLYSLIVQPEMSAVTTVGSAYTRVTDSVVTNAIQEDAFHVRALGKSAYSIWRLLLSSPSAKTIKEISEATGRSASTVGANLIKLERVQLASKETTLGKPVRWIGWQSTEGQLDEIAAGLGTKGKAAARKAKHIEERQKRVSHLLIEQKRRILRRRAQR